MNYSTYNLGNITLQSGKILKDAKIAYKTYGKLNEEKDNVIIYPTWYSGFISDNEWLIGEDKTLNPDKYFIIVPSLFGNGQSSSPSNNKTWSNVSLYDNVINQYRLVTELFKITKIKLVIGWSMGAMQAFQWGCLYPDIVENILPFCGAASTSAHNFVFLEGPKAALQTDMIYDNGDYIFQPEKGIRAFARVYAGWGFTQQFYNLELYKSLGYHSLQDFLVNFWEEFFLKRDANNLLALIWTWQYGNISDNEIFKGDFEKSLKAIKARVLILSPENDLYFPKEDNEEEIKLIKNGELVVIPGVWGHFSGGGLNKEDTDFIDKQIKILLEGKK